MAQLSNDKDVLAEIRADKTVTRPKRLRIRRQRKKKSANKRKNNLFFKRKRLIRSLIIRKRNLSMNEGQESSPAVFKSTTRWQHKDEIAFWKARAVSLEYENKMLHKHIKQMYVSMISQNNQNIDNTEYYPEETQEYEDQEGEDEQEQYFEDEDNDLEETNQCLYERDKERPKKKEDNEDAEESKPPTEQSSKKREEEMKQLYGTAWRKIMGMETAVQLNFDLSVEKNKTNYWPVVPIKI